MMDDELDQLYRSKWDVLSKAIPPNCGMSNPLLAAVPSEYEKLKRRLLIIGKETHDWGLWDERSKTDPIRALRNGYEGFGRGKKWNSPFFQAARRLQKKLNPDSDPSAFMWLNLLICDQNQKTPTPEIIEKLRAISFLREEISILQPHAVVFFTGPVYDYTIKHRQYFPDAEFEPQLPLWSKVRAAGLPAKTARTYHPKYLRLKKQFGILDDISAWITQAQ